MSKAGAGGLLREARKRLNLTQTEVGNALKVTCAYISDTELGKRSVPVYRIPQFAKVLKLSSEEITRLYKQAGVLPEGVKERLQKAPGLWEADFLQLQTAIEATIEELGRHKSVKALRDALQAHPRK
jgi:transcriptional regulator with XRE-family HTH domain